MSANRSSFEKLQRDRAKKAKQALKREKKLDRSTDVEVDDEAAISVSDFGEELSAADLLKLVETLHQQFDNGTISFEEFEDQKTELFARLPVD
ncbi:MAG: hypothetical protein WKF43_11590 [Acidimicrobiales bacterium]